MGLRVEDYLHGVEVLKTKIENTLKAAAITDAPKLRPAEAKDIYMGNVLWLGESEWVEYKNDDWCEGHLVKRWRIVKEVWSPKELYKGWCADDGCRYGLEGWFVEDFSQGKS